MVIFTYFLLVLLFSQFLFVKKYKYFLLFLYQVKFTFPGVDEQRIYTDLLVLSFLVNKRGMSSDGHQLKKENTDTEGH